MVMIYFGRIIYARDGTTVSQSSSQYFFQEREMKLQQEGVGIKMDSVLPHLVLVNDDLLSTGIVVYHLKV